MMIFEIFQFAMFNRFKKILVHCVANQIILFKIKINCLLYLHVTIITQLKSFLILNKVKMKLIIKTQKRSENFLTKNSYLKFEN